MSEAEVHYSLSAKGYHGDADGPRLSQSLAVLAACKTPLHAWQAHPLLGAAPWRYEVSDDDGSLIHSLILEPDSKLIEELDPSTVHTKDGKPAKSPFATEEGKALRAAAAARGSILMLTEVLGVYKYKAAAIRSRLADIGVVFDGDSEVVIYWEEQGPFGPVRCRARLDHLTFRDGRARIIDLKTCDSAHADDAQMVLWKKGYDIQRAAYTRAVEAAFPDYVGRVDFVLAFGELEKPYAVNAITLDAELQRVGEQRWERGRDRWAEGLRSDKWPGYTGAVVGMPGWAKAREMVE